MKVKIGDKIYDAENEPIMIILNDSDKKTSLICIQKQLNIVVTQKI